TSLLTLRHIATKKNANNALFTDTHVIPGFVCIARMRKHKTRFRDAANVTTSGRIELNGEFPGGARHDRDAEAYCGSCDVGYAVPLFHVGASTNLEGIESILECDRHLSLLFVFSVAGD